MVKGLFITYTAFCLFCATVLSMDKFTHAFKSVSKSFSSSQRENIKNTDDKKENDKGSELTVNKEGK